MNFRVYRLPGSRGTWLVDSGEETQQHTVYGIEIKCYAISREKPDAIAPDPRAWIEVHSKEMYVVDNIAIFPGAA